MEFGGAGIFREELTYPLGVRVPVLAWGLGIDRLAMFRLGIRDIRQLFSQDLDWLRKKVIG
jgi:phenylalanyl-tRNA synthetase alpha chain